MKTHSSLVAGLRLGSTLVAAAVAATLFAQEPYTPTTPATEKPGDALKVKSTLKHGDESFLKDAAKANAEEVAISQVALERTANPQVKEFAQMMVSDHTGAGAKVTELASSKNVMLPAKEVKTDRWASKDSKDPAEFDRDYMKKMVDAHQDAVKLFQKASEKGEDTEVKTFASTTLPKLQEHLTKAQEIQASLK